VDKGCSCGADYPDPGPRVHPVPGASQSHPGHEARASTPETGWVGRAGCARSAWIGRCGGGVL